MEHPLSDIPEVGPAHFCRLWHNGRYKPDSLDVTQHIMGYYTTRNYQGSQEEWRSLVYLLVPVTLLRSTTSIPLDSLSLTDLTWIR